MFCLKIYSKCFSKIYFEVIASGRKSIIIIIICSGGGKKTVIRLPPLLKISFSFKKFDLKNIFKIINLVVDCLFFSKIGFELILDGKNFKKI